MPHDLRTYYPACDRPEVTRGWTREGAEEHGRWSVNHDGARLVEVVDDEGSVVETLTAEAGDQP